MKTQTLWSVRTTVARGKVFVAERQVTDETADAWLAIFRKDEPSVLFTVSAHKPRQLPNQINSQQETP